jgi:tetratricopeptide (TPR) repeat protein
MPAVVGSEAEPSVAPGTEVGGYVVEARIGVGGFGEVYRARHPVIDRVVAIKILHARYSANAEAVARFVAEARAVNKISHAGIVEVFDFGELDGREYFVMELLAGITLRDRLAERGRLPLAEALPILRGIAEAVDAAHAAGVAHRDLKPDNVFILADGRTKLIDFGLAKLTREEAPVTQTGSIFGTPMYMSPEQCRGGALDTRTDLYSFGVLVYHVLTGEPPFDGDAIELALHHVNDHPAPPSQCCAELPRHVDRVVLALLAKDPADRPPSLVTAVAALEGSVRLRRNRTRLLRRLAAGVVLAGVATAGVGMATRSRDDCVSGRARLDGVWDASARGRLAAAFAMHGREYVRASWRVTSTDLDQFASKWSAAWDEACHADRSDALLYAERTTCLENQLQTLRGWVAMLDTYRAATDLRSLGAVPQYGRVLSDCANRDVLRAQIPATAEAHRARVDQLLLDVYRANASGFKAAGDRTSIDDSLARLDGLATQIEVLDPPRAALPLLLRADIATHVAWDYANRLPRARRVLADAIARIEAGHDDVAIADIHTLEANFDAFIERDGDPRALAEVAIGKAAAAIERAGHPHDQVENLMLVRGVLARATGDHDRAITEFRAAVAQVDPDDGDDELPTSRWQLATALAAAGRQRDAFAEIDRIPTQVSSTHMGRADLLDYGGDLDGALREAMLLGTEMAMDDGPKFHDAWNGAWITNLRIRLGRVDPARELAAIHALAHQGTTPPKQNPDGPSTARRAGHFEAFAYAAERELATDTDEALDNAAILAFQRGDTATAKTLGAKVEARCHVKSCADWIRTSRWFVAEPASFAALEREYDGDRSAVATSGILLASLGRWDAARTKLEAARAIPNVWERHSDLLEADTWLALARLEHGDPAGARALLEEANDVLAFYRNGFEGFSYMTPVAQLELAKLLPATDHARARRLAERARDGFVRLGPLRAAQKQAAIDWLAQN